METIVVNPHGFCEGVVKAIALAKKAKREHPNEEIHVIGMLVHNEEVTKKLANEGLIFHDEKEKPLFDQLSSLKDGSVIVFAAHGHEPRLDKLAKEKNMTIYDATCEFVNSNAKSIKDEISKGHEVIYIGKEGHAESVGAIGIDSKKVFLCDPSKENTFWHSIKDPSPAVVSQTTMDLADLYFAKKALSVLFPKARFKDERCFATKKRQEALYKVGEDVDVFVILGSCTSNNTMKLCSIAKDNFPKADVYRINSMEELKAVKLEGKKRVALASGASTSPEFFNKVNDYLRKYKASNK